MDAPLAKTEKNYNFYLIPFRTILSRVLALVRESYVFQNIIKKVSKQLSEITKTNVVKKITAKIIKHICGQYNTL